MHPSLMNIALTIPTLLSVVSGLPLVALEEAGSGKPTASPGGVQSIISIGTAAKTPTDHDPVSPSIYIAEHKGTNKAKTHSASSLVNDACMIERGETFMAKDLKYKRQPPDTTFITKTVAPTPVAMDKRAMPSTAISVPTPSAMVRHVRDPPVDEPTNAFPGPVGGPKLAPESFVLTKRNATDGTLYQPVMCTGKACPRSNKASRHFSVRNELYAAHFEKRNASDGTLYRPMGLNPGGNPVTRRNDYGAERSDKRDTSGVWRYVTEKESNAGADVPLARRNASDGTLHVPNVGGGGGKGGVPIIARHGVGIEKLWKRNATDGTSYFPNGVPVNNDGEEVNEVAGSVVSAAGRMKI